jgi:hypothetical protein
MSYIKRTLAALLFSILSAAQGAESAAKPWGGNYLSAFEHPREVRTESFQTLLASSVPSRSMAEDLALQYWHSSQGLLAEEGLEVTGLFHVGRQINGFATSGEWIWEIHVTHLGFGLDGIIWINAHTRKIRALGPKS